MAVTGRSFPCKCELHKHRALPAELKHPPSVYVREDAIIGPLNEWIEKLADPEVLAAGQAGDPGLAARLAGLRTELRETKIKISKLIASIEPASTRQCSPRRSPPDRRRRTASNGRSPQ